MRKYKQVASLIDTQLFLCNMYIVRSSVIKKYLVKFQFAKKSLLLYHILRKEQKMTETAKILLEIINCLSESKQKKVLILVTELFVQE